MPYGSGVSDRVGELVGVLLHSTLPGFWRATKTATDAVGISLGISSSTQIPELLSALHFCGKPAADDGFNISSKPVRGDPGDPIEMTAASRPLRAAGSANPGIQFCQLGPSSVRFQKHFQICADPVEIEFVSRCA
jgi:hypothetical protein